MSLAVLLMAGACVTTKKKNAEVGWLKKGYHNMTSRYNYWFNADELLTLALQKQELAYTDNYSQILDLYPYAAADPQPIRGDMDNVILKSSKAIAIHRVSDWTDDCYSMIGQAQYLKRDFETAEATFKYIREEHDPKKKNKSKLKSGKKKKESVKKKKTNSKKKKKKTSRKKKKSSKKKKNTKKDGKATDTSKPGATPTPAPAAPKEDLVLAGENPYDKGLSRTAAFPKAMIWYGRTLVEREKYDEADFLFRELEDDRFFPADQRKELAKAEAYLWMKQKRYDKAVEPLERAVQLAGKKKERARLAYILAQLYEQFGQNDKAYAALETTLNSNPEYTMEFNARLHLIQAGWANGKISSAEANQSLEKMAKESKNAEFRDQIYFVMAGIALNDGLKKDAIVLYRKSLNFSVANTNQRSESYLKLADLYFESEDFVSAKKYYDSTLTVLPAADERFKRVSTYAENLTDIARYITTIAANDSIVRIYNMSDEERKELAIKIKKQREEEAIAAAAEAQKKAAAKPATTPGPKSLTTPVAGQAPSSFYFYNEAFLKKGKKDFNKAWGDRKQEDNWRRSNRPVTSGPNDVAGADSLNANDLNDTDLSDIFQGVPSSEAELATLHLSTYEAMYNLGVLFRDRLENNKRCSGTLEDMLARYPDTLKYEKETWYYCYLAFTDLKNPERARFYLDKLVGKYPNSPFARSITDPNFLNASKERERELNQFYEQTYSYFQNGDYKSAFDRCQEAPRKYGSTNALMAKFALLSALCTGSLQGNDAYCQALKEVIARYPESAEATRAKEIARVLACKGFEVDDVKANPNANTATLDNDFAVEDDKLHYLLVAVSGDVRLDDIKGAISDYNREFHKTDQLRISNIFLCTDTNTPIVVIRKFDNKEQVMRYYNEVKNRKEFLGETSKISYSKEYFAITQENYRRVLKNKTLEGYREFFDEKYLKK
ncbi:MAG: hypothetical protein IT260_12670 [Saprospiraceae bacterium]|nr:hypothetical protein [Saprospiraceae bacterium]